MVGRPPFKPTKAQRDAVKLMKADGWSNERIAAQLEVARNTLEKAFATELEFGADSKRLKVLKDLDKASSKGNASASKQLLERYEVAKAAQVLRDREQPGEPAREAKLGKKEQQQQAAEQVTGKFAPPPAPKLLN
jgi:hypothetical protein